MLRHLLRNFQRVLILQPTTTISPETQVNRVWRRTLFHVEKFAKKEETDASATTELDNEYVVPFRIEPEERSTKNSLVLAYRKRFRLSSSDVMRIRSDSAAKRSFPERALFRTLETLCLEGVTKRSFMENPWLITLDRIRLQQKLALLRTVSVQNINHLVPFLRLTVPRLRKLVHILNNEKSSVPHGNRIYYISERLKMDPYEVAQYLSKRLFIFEMPFEMVEQNLMHLINYNVSPTSILKDLWAFRYKPIAVRLRLERVKRAKKDKIMPWMVRCTEPILQRTLKLSLDELAVLGDKASAVEYIADRLQFTVEETKAIMAKHPAVNSVRVTKIKEVLDYLLDEAGFTRYEIAQVPRILCHGLETTKRRMEELKSIGCRPTSLVIVCRSKREYEKFFNAWKATQFTNHVPRGQDEQNDEQHQESQNNKKEEQK